MSTRFSALLLFVAASLPAQAPLGPTIVGEVRDYAFRSTPADNPGTSTKLVVEKLVRFEGASFVTLEFEHVVLGEGSRLEIESVLDLDAQSFDRFTIDDYGPWSGYFNGDAVLVRLFAGPKTKAQGFAIRKAGVGNRAAAAQPLALCGADTRVLSSDPRVARLVTTAGTKIGICTASLISPVNCFATAGHCMSGGVTRQSFHFNVPASTSTGAPMAAALVDQYEWQLNTSQTYRFEDKGIGKDWGVLTSRRNAKTFRWPGSVQRAWFRFGPVPKSGTSVRVTGHGTDLTPNKTYNFRQQTDAGPFVLKKSSSDEIVYRVDTTGGTSGSVVTISASAIAIGVNTHETQCTSFPLTGNHGTYQGRVGFMLARNALCREIPRPDLVIASLRVGATQLVGGQTLRITSRVKNQGMAAVGPGGTTTGIYLSKSQWISTTDTPLGAYTTPSLGIGASEPARTIDVQVPNLPFAGYYIGAYADRNKRVQESHEGNNSLNPVRVGIRPRPDFVPTALTSSATAVVSGRAYTVSATIKNEGIVAPPTATWYADFRLSTNPAISAADLPLGTVGHSSILNAGASVRLTRSVTIPVRAPNGRCYLGVIADSSNRVAEFSETNNTKALTMSCSGGSPVPDLVAEAVASTSGTVFTVGERKTLSSRIRNTGTAGAPVCTSGYYVSTNSNITSADMLMGSFATPVLQPNIAQTHSASYAVPVGVPTQATCYLGVWADRLGQVAESNRVNNRRATPIRCVGKPDLVVTQAGGAASWRANAVVAVSSQVRNQGGVGTTRPFYFRYYFSKDSTISSADTLLRNVYVSPNLAAGASKSDSSTIRVPADVPTAQCYMAVWVDGPVGVVPESNEANNVRVEARGCIGLPDLVVTSLSPPASTVITAGSTIAVDHRTQNRGGVATSRTTHTGLFLSSDFRITSTDLLLASVQLTTPTSRLLPGASLSRRTSVRVPFGTLPGSYYLGAYADVNGAELEGSEVNNTKANLLTCKRSPLLPKWKRLEYEPRLGSSATSTDFASFSAQAGTRVPFVLTAPSQAGQLYVLFAYCTPPASPPHLDFCSNLTLSMLNTPVFSKWFGALDKNGQGFPVLDAPKGFLRLKTKFTVWTSAVLIDPAKATGQGIDNYVTTVIRP